MIRDAARLIRHAVHCWRAGQVRFRLETFGVYYPALPYTAPWWKAPPSNLLLLCRQGPAYLAWILEMDQVRRGGSMAWWIRYQTTPENMRRLLDDWNA